MDAHTAAASAAPVGTFFGRNEFLIRRLHSLTGLFPVGFYMCVHLVTNASTLGGPAMFQKNVDLIHSLGPALPIVEWTFIFLPLIVPRRRRRRGSYAAANPNLSSYYYVGNVRYYLQRAHGVDRAGVHSSPGTCSKCTAGFITALVARSTLRTKTPAAISSIRTRRPPRPRSPCNR